MAPLRGRFFIFLIFLLLKFLKFSETFYMSSKQLGEMFKGDSGDP